MKAAHFGWCGPTRWRSWRGRGRCPNYSEGPVMAIELPDARLLSDEVLDALRLRALRARERGFTEADSADLLGVARETVCRWWSAYGSGGVQALPQPRHGRPLGSGRFLSDDQAAHIQDILDHRQPKAFVIACPLVDAPGGGHADPAGVRCPAGAPHRRRLPAALGVHAPT